MPSDWKLLSVIRGEVGKREGEEVDMSKFGFRMA